MSCDITQYITWISYDIVHYITLFFSAMRLLEDATQCLHVKELAR